MTRTRVALGVLGVAVTAYGALRLVELGWDNLVATAVWLAGAVLLHDAVLAPATLLVCALGVLVLPRRLHGPAAAGLLVLGPLPVTAVPVLGRIGARPENPPLLDRDYLTGWLVVAALVLLGVGAWAAASWWRATARRERV